MTTGTTNIKSKANIQEKMWVWMGMQQLINKPPCCTLAMAMLQLLSAPSDPHPAQKKILATVSCAP